MTNEKQHIHCGTPECCQSCIPDSMWRRIKDRITNIYSTIKGIGIYLKHGHRGLRSRELNRRK